MNNLLVFNQLFLYMGKKQKNRGTQPYNEP